MGEVVCTLELLLHHRGITIAQFAKETGIGYNTLKRLCENPAGVEFATLAKICGALNCGVSQILRYKKNGVFVDDNEWSAVLTGRVILDFMQEKVSEQNSKTQNQTTELNRQINSLMAAHLGRQQADTEAIRGEMLRMTQRAIGRFVELTAGENVAQENQRRQDNRSK
ncbi:hypothetical protein GlitD10_2522 [Gloeomargarita lithophora Alchichica-D10]|uniref:HTH cro/C1-type domain-containing protein n=1 Tax=Gloeomargarita lithophora Alchichica-D10 TaxID=1188229 RepID=A0A1J0AG29_9CYAN|nr:helix-turn-helix transcriptional regulator [Gloeomargarita lithophora]APB34859.1 hypothetical protein GlitD10_2522 [Gloeomargarita lithophora Alchichica-D10]